MGDSATNGALWAGETRREGKASINRKPQRRRCGCQRDALGERTAMVVLGIDIGASKVRIGAYSADDVDLDLLRVERYPTANWSSLGEVLKAFLADAGLAQVDAIAIGAAGPVTERVITLTNLGWRFDLDEIGRLADCKHVFAINDLAAHGYGILGMNNSQHALIQAGIVDSGGPRAVIAAGTGLGQAIMIPGKEGIVVSPSEGGHVGFSPRNDRDLDLLRFLLKRYPGHVSWERVVSGRFGFKNIVDYMTQGQQSVGFSELAAKVEGRQDVAADVVSAADAGDLAAIHAVEHFVELYGAAAGDLALTCMAVGGVYVAGGVARRMVPWLTTGRFRDGFCAKGRMSAIMRSIPVYLVTNREVAIDGLAKYATFQLPKQKTQKRGSSDMSNQNDLDRNAEPRA